jgi:molecular chaperone HscB
MNYFELFEIPVSLDINKNALSKKYFELQRKYHPDFFTQSTEEEKAAALEKSSIINKAFKILQDEDERTKYLLQIKGLLKEDEKYQLPPEFLMEMMELNETSSEEATKYSDDLYREVKVIIEHYNDTAATNETLLKLKEYYYKKKYLQRILDRTAG